MFCGCHDKRIRAVENRGRQEIGEGLTHQIGAAAFVVARLRIVDGVVKEDRGVEGIPIGNLRSGLFGQREHIRDMGPAVIGAVRFGVTRAEVGEDILRNIHA
jgi:hypothetical protein